MTHLQAILLGILQGVTEFFPISSSAHLRLFRQYLGLSSDPYLLFDLVCHLGSLGALLAFFRKEIFFLLKAPKHWFPYLIALLPLVPIYALFRGYLPDLSSWFGVFLMVTGLLLFTASYSQARVSSSEKISDVLCIGIMQSMALIPGFSRSGSTIATACLRGWEIKPAIQFSFLLAVPTVLGGALLEGWSLLQKGDFFPLPKAHYVLGFIFSFLCGLLAVKGLSLITRSRLKWFAIYCLGMGAISIFYGNE